MRPVFWTKPEMSFCLKYEKQSERDSLELATSLQVAMNYKKKGMHGLLHQIIELLNK